MVDLGLMEKRMEATVVYWGYIGIMENKLGAIFFRLTSPPRESSHLRRVVLILSSLLYGGIGGLQVLDSWMVLPRLSNVGRVRQIRSSPVSVATQLRQLTAVALKQDEQNMSPHTPRQ